MEVRVQQPHVMVILLIWCIATMAEILDFRAETRDMTATDMPHSPKPCGRIAKI